VKTRADETDREPPKNEHAVALSALGAAEGGRARANKLTPSERREIARHGAVTRWMKEKGEVLPAAAYGSPDKPLRIANIEIPCYVLEDGRRVIVQGGMLTALDMKQGTAGRGAGDRLAKFVGTKALAEFLAPEVAEMITNPIIFRAPNGRIAYGYEATILPDMCDAVLLARQERRLNYQQAHIADQCEILVRGLAKTGVIALVDEATGYQEVRARDALAKILEQFISEELRKWVSTFPVDFYREMFRLKSWDYTKMKPNSPKPLTVGKITDDLVYKRLAPGIRDELRRITTRNEKGYLQHKLHQRLTDDVGHPKLREHLAALVALMKASDSWTGFKRAVDRALPRYDAPLELPLND
jgi:hypothetical protein